MEETKKRTAAQAQYMAEQFGKNIASHGFVPRPYDRVNYLQVFHRGVGQQEQFTLHAMTDTWRFSIPGFKNRYTWLGTGLKEANTLLESFAARASIL